MPQLKGRVNQSLEGFCMSASSILILIESIFLNIVNQFSLE